MNTVRFKPIPAGARKREELASPPRPDNKLGEAGWGQGLGPGLRSGLADVCLGYVPDDDPV